MSFSLSVLFALGSSLVKATDQYAIASYYDSDKCWKTRDWQGSRVFISGDTQGVIGRDGVMDVSCAEGLACFFNPTSEQCQSLNPNNEPVDNSFLIYDNGTIANCDPSNAAVGQEECNILGDECSESSFTQCFYDLLP